MTAPAPRRPDPFLSFFYAKTVTQQPTSGGGKEWETGGKGGEKQYSQILLQPIVAPTRPEVGGSQGGKGRRENAWITREAHKPLERQKRVGRAERHGIPLPNHEPQQKKAIVPSSHVLGGEKEEVGKGGVGC